MFALYQVKMLSLIFLFLNTPVIAYHYPGQYPGHSQLRGQQNCTSCEPNPIGDEFPASITGTINGTVAVLVVDIDYARSLIPSEYNILEQAYTQFGIPSTSYPIIVETTINHDIQYQGSNAHADFSSVRITFPFIDLLNDGYSSFRYSPRIALPDNADLATAAKAYGEEVSTSVFYPANAGWGATRLGKIFFAAYPLGLRSRYSFMPSFRLLMTPEPEIAPYSLLFYQNVTSQPMFATPVNCDNNMRLWKTSVSEGEYAPQGMKGSVFIGKPFLKETMRFKGAHGVRGDTAFIETHYVPCNMLKGNRLPDVGGLVVDNSEVGTPRMGALDEGGLESWVPGMGMEE